VTILEGRCPDFAQRLRLSLAVRTRLRVPPTIRRQIWRCLDEIDELGATQMLHDRDFNSFLRFASAWKKFAFTAPTDVPTISAI